MKWNDVINALRKGNDKFFETKCGSLPTLRSAMRYMTQDEIWSHRKDNDGRVRRMVAEKIEDQDRLWEMRNDRDTTVYDMVTLRIKDEGRICELIKKSGRLGMAIAKRIKNKDYIVEALAVQECLSDGCKYVVGKLAGDEDRLKTLYETANCDGIKIMAAAGLNDQEALWSLRHTRNEEAILIVIEHIEDQDRLWEMLLDGITGKDFTVLYYCGPAIVGRLTSEERLASIVAKYGGTQEPEGGFTGRIGTAATKRLEEIMATKREDTV